MTRNRIGRRLLSIGLAGALCGAVGLAVARPAAAVDWNATSGHISLGYSQLFIAKAPAGSLSVRAGFDYPVVGAMRAGLDIGFHLLGSRTLQSGSLAANLDYDVFEVTAFTHWVPRGLGPVGRISVGPSLLSTRATLSSAGGGIEFTRYAVEDVAPGAALDVTFMSKRETPIRVGFEVGTRIAFRPGDDWSLASANLTFHF